MTDKIHLKVITHEKVAYEQDIDELYVQATDGAVGILKNHVPVICALNIGVAKVVDGKNTQCITVMGGILNFNKNNAVILTDIAELDCDIDEARAMQAKERAEARLKAKDEDIDTLRAQMALSRAMARLAAKNNHRF